MTTQATQATPFASRLRDLRRSRGLTQQALADAAGLTNVHVSRLERGSRGAGIRHETLRRLAQALGVGIDDLI